MTQNSNQGFVSDSLSGGSSLPDYTVQVSDGTTLRDALRGYYAFTRNLNIVQLILGVKRSRREQIAHLNRPGRMDFEASY